MCLICDKDAVMLSTGGYRRCEYCKTYIAEVLPDNGKVQKVLEEHANLYILGGKESLDIYAHEAKLTLIKRFSKSIKAILDFGCGNSSLVKFLLSKGYKAFAYDKSEIIKKHLSAQAIPFYKNLNEIPNNYFDVVTCFDVIEHTTDPQGLIRHIKEKLKTNGILMITTPNAQSISSLVLGQKWWVFGSTAHFILFSPRSLKVFLINEGFEVLDVRTDTLTPWFTPSGKLLFRALNKLIYHATLPFHTFLFSRYLGDNIQVVARSNMSEKKYK